MLPDLAAVDLAEVGVIVALVDDAAYEAGLFVVVVVSLGTRVAREVAAACVSTADAAIDARRLARGCCCSV